MDREFVLSPMLDLQAVQDKIKAIHDKSAEVDAFEIQEIDKEDSNPELNGSPQSQQEVREADLQRGPEGDTNRATFMT
jgi:hypothetical protein